MFVVGFGLIELGNKAHRKWKKYMKRTTNSISFFGSFLLVISDELEINSSKHGV